MTTKINLLLPYRQIKYKRASKQWYAENREKVLAKTGAYQRAHPEKRRAYAKTYYERHPGLHAAKHKRWGQGQRDRILTALGNRCKACGITEKAVLTLDHIQDDGAVERRQYSPTTLYTKILRDGVPADRYQCLCHNCQWRKRRYGPDVSKWPGFSRAACG